MKKILRRTLSAALMLLMLVSLGTAAFAIGEADLDRDCSITVSLQEKKDSDPLAGISFTLFKVASGYSDRGMLQFQLTADFKASGESLDDLNSPALPGRLAEYAENNKLSGTVLSTEGTSLCFSGLKTGLYLLVENGNVEGYSPVSPFLVNLPMTEQEGTEWVYDVSASPKVAPTPVPPETVDITVIKKWDDQGKGNRVPVTAVLYENGTEKDRVELSEANNWKHTWKNMDKNSEWLVREAQVPSGYTVKYERSEYTFTIVNVKDLIITGQLIWPVPVLAGMGVLLFAAGWVMAFGKRKNEEN